MRKTFILMIGVIFLCGSFSLAQNFIDFEDMLHDVYANDAYQAATPFYPGVLIKTIDNSSGIPVGWPAVVRAGTTCTSIDPGTLLVGIFL